ncbi:MAG: hypothetical protein U1A24_20435 [Cypionkella sp.]|nr:hypothetical protein [Cypionkella sp.]MDZ4312922.1 hypothetical protein [Cypionkella sp.]MDZ4392392.1 hypothetical protein [Cypionkella sp.]
MFTEITEILKRSNTSLVADAAGVVSLFALLFAGLGISGTL